MKYINKLSDVLGKKMAFLSLGAALFALVFPQLVLPLTKVRIASLSLTNVLLGVIMFGMGLTLKGEDFALILKRPKDVLIGVLAQYTVMPLGALLVAKLLNLPPDLAFGLILLGCVPGGTASNVMTFLAKGDVALSVTVTTCTTLLAPVLTSTLSLYLGGEWVSVNFFDMLKSIVIVVLLPILMGLLVRFLVGESCKKIQKLLVLISVLSIVTIVAMCVAPNVDKVLSASSIVVVFAVFLHHLLGLTAGYGICKLAKMDTKKVHALSIEVGLQNSGLAVGLAGGFSSTLPMAVLPSAVATVVHQIFGSIVANFFASRDQGDDAEVETIPTEEVKGALS